MGVVKFYIIFDKPDKVYYPGEMVTGRVELVIDSVLKIRAVELKIKGRAKCKWYGQNGRRRALRKSSEIYLNSKLILIGGEDKFKLPLGEHTYRFAVMLPLKAPSSFSSFHGDISYYGKAKIDIPFAFDEEVRTGFTVISPLNLDLFPNLSVPYKNEKSKTFYCLCCSSGLLTIVVRLPKTGFSKFEPIPITLEVENASNVTVDMVYACLIRAICWTADGHKKKKDWKLPKFHLGRVEAGQSHTWSKNFTIPSLSFPNLDYCTIIKMGHKLHIEADASGMHFDLNMDIPVTIVDVLLIKNPDAPRITPQMQTFLDNKAGDPGMQMLEENAPSPYPTHNPPEGKQSYPEAFGEPSLEVCPANAAGHVVPQPGMNNTPPNLRFSAPSPYQNAGGMPQGPIQGNSVSDFDLAFPSFNSNVQLERTSFFSDSKSQTVENFIVTTPSIPPSPTAPPHSYRETS